MRAEAQRNGDRYTEMRKVQTEAAAQLCRSSERKCLPAAGNPRTEHLVVSLSGAMGSSIVKDKTYSAAVFLLPSARRRGPREVGRG